MLLMASGGGAAGTAPLVPPNEVVQVQTEHGGVGGETAPRFTAVPKHLLTRLLFCNPCCGLVTRNADGTHNAMTVSWLTPADNHALFLLSLNAKRHTLVNLRERPGFTLSLWAEGLEGLALACGGSSGAGGGGGESGKLKALGARLCAVGEPALPAFADAPAHLRCVFLRALGGDDAARGHVVLLCEVEEARVNSTYWFEGKVFRAPAGAPRPLCFAGSGVFVPMG